MPSTTVGSSGSTCPLGGWVGATVAGAVSAGLLVGATTSAVLGGAVGWGESHAATASSPIQIHLRDRRTQPPSPGLRAGAYITARGSWRGPGRGVRDGTARGHA